MFHEIVGLLKSNPLLAGGAGMAAMGGLLVQLRSLPAKLAIFLRGQLTTSLTVYSEDQLFTLVDIWLSRHPSLKRVRHFGVASWWESDFNSQAYSLTPGQGMHLLREGTRFYMVRRHVDLDKSTSADGPTGAKRRQTIEVVALGRSSKSLVHLLERLKRVKEEGDTIPIHLWDEYDFKLIERRPKRAMDTVYLEHSTKQKVVEDIGWYLANRAWYVDRGVPYRRGYMFEGPPGTGKTTLIIALASYFEKPVYIINPSTILNDNTLQRALSAAGSNIVVIEDIDSLSEAGDRDGKEKTRQGAVANSGITLAGLLNAIDGIGARDGRMLFITTNHPEVLDSALVRPGRIDFRAHLGYIAEDAVRQMYTKFFPQGDADAFCAEIAPELPISPAALQNRLLGLGLIGSQA